MKTVIKFVTCCLVFISVAVTDCILRIMYKFGINTLHIGSLNMDMSVSLIVCQALLFCSVLLMLVVIVSVFIKVHNLSTEVHL